MYIYISYSLKNFYTCTYAHIYNIYIYSCANLHVQSFWSTCMHFSLITMAGKKIETWEQFYRNSRISEPSNTSSLQQNLNLLEHLSRRLDDSLNVLNIFLSRCEELNIPETLTTNIRRLLEELHSIHRRILHITISEHDFVLNSNHPCFLSSAEPICTGRGRPRQRVSAVEIN